MPQHDQIIQDGTGAVVRGDINAALAALFSSSSGDTEPETKQAGQVWFDTGVDPAALRVRNEANTGWIAIATGFDYSQLMDAFAAKAAKSANRRNFLVNPTCQISQENGDTASATAASQIPAYYPADQWGVLWNLTGGTANAQRKQGAEGGSDYVSFNVVTAVASPGGGDRAEITQDLEGLKVKAFNWFTNGGGKDGVLRFAFYCSVAGTYTAFIRGPSYSYFVNFAATVGWKVYTFKIPAPAGSTAGTWPKNNTKTMTVGVGLTSGAGFKAPGEGWQQSAACQAPNASNGAATAGAIFGLTDVGFYVDPDKVGIAPPFEIPDYEDDIIACRRYWFCSNPDAPKGGATGTYTGYSAVANTLTYGNWRFTAPMRTPPTTAALSIWSNGVKSNVRNTNTGAAIAVGNVSSTPMGAEGGATIGVTTLAAAVWCDFDIQVNVRM